MDVDSSSKFIGSLTKFLQSLCNGYVEFQRGVELVGHIYLSIDTGEKVDYILHEKVSKNDENSVTFVSNSFHAQPQDIKEKEKEKASASKNTNAKSGAGASGLVDTSDDDDIMIVDQTKGVPGSTNSGTIPSRGTKRVASPSPDQRQAQRNRNIGAPSLSRSPGSSNPLLSPTRNLDSRQQLGGPSATITSRDAAQENLNMADVKLEQISRDELLSLATQVGEGGSGPSQSTSSAPRPQLQRSGASAGGSGDAASWIKQEAADDNGGGDSDTGWSQGRDDSNSNSGSNLYPVMLHQNPAAYSNPVFPGFSGSNTSSANPYANPVPGTSQDMGGLDPSVSAGGFGQVYEEAYASEGSWLDQTREKKRLHMRKKREQLKQNPQLFHLYRQRQREYDRRYRDKQRQRRVYKGGRLHSGVRFLWMTDSGRTHPWMNQQDQYAVRTSPSTATAKTEQGDKAETSGQDSPPVSFQQRQGGDFKPWDVYTNEELLFPGRGYRRIIPPGANLNTEKSRRRRARLKQSPHRLEHYREKQRQYNKRYQDKLKQKHRDSTETHIKKSSDENTEN